MEIINITAERRADWNTLAAREPYFSLLQSWEWGDFKEESGWKPFRVAVQDKGSLIAGAQMLIKSAPLGIASMAYVPRGPIGDWMNESASALLLDELRRIARHHRAVFLRIEPSLPDDSSCAPILQRHGFRSSPYTNQPRATIMVNLSQGMDALMAQFHQKTRYNIRYSAKQGVTMRIGGEDDLPMFHRLMTITGSRGAFTVRSLDYYLDEWKTFSKTGQMKLFIAEYEGKPIAVNMSAVFGRCAAYLHGGSSGEHANLQPNYLIMWEAMQWAHSQGCESFDLWGIPDEVGVSVYQASGELPISERTDGLWGVYRFKRGFSKDVLLFASAHDHAFSNFLYALATNRYFSTDTFETLATFIDRFRNSTKKTSKQ
jgi:lipid II:glycine glycyltransferase (peptidoglycan interpeptide bridge formation enzyme)